MEEGVFQLERSEVTERATAARRPQRRRFRQTDPGNLVEVDWILSSYLLRSKRCACRLTTLYCPKWDLPLRGPLRLPPDLLLAHPSLHHARRPLLYPTADDSKDEDGVTLSTTRIWVSVDLIHPLRARGYWM